MALTPKLSYSERNDNKLLTVTDITGIYDASLNPGGWGTPNSNPVDVAVFDLDISITTSDGTITTYETIDLHALHEHATIGVLTWEIDASMLLVGTVPLGTNDTELPDGIWNMTYTIDGVSGTSENVLIEGAIRVAVYKLLRTIPTVYNCNECKSKAILDALYCYACLNIIQSNAYAAKTEELISLLYFLERLVINGSNYTW